jgi:hypothetical protein
VEILERTLADDDDADPFLNELIVVVAQLRDVPAAERSPVVSQEDQGDGLLGPKGRKTRRCAVQSDDFGVGRALTNRRMHARERTGWESPNEIGGRPVPCLTL